MKSFFAVIALLALGSGAQAQQTQTTVQPAATTPAAAAKTDSSQSGLGFSKHDSNAPINVSSDNFLGDLTSKVGVYSGNVVVVQGDMKMRADRMRVETVESKASKIYGYGNVVVDAPNGTATGDNGIYDLNVHTITLTGKQVVMTKEKNVMRGTMVVMDMTTNLAHMTAKGMAGNRVQGVFIPAQKPDATNGAAKKPTPGGGK
jgi:lipopolysaccharide export system protein LptA